MKADRRFQGEAEAQGRAAVVDFFCDLGSGNTPHGVEHKLGNVRTETLRAFSAADMKTILGKVA